VGRGLKTNRLDFYDDPEDHLGSYAAPAAWNTLPTSLQQISDTETFKRHLKTFLFCHAF